MFPNGCYTCLDTHTYRVLGRGIPGMESPSVHRDLKYAVAHNLRKSVPHNVPYILSAMVQSQSMPDPLAASSCLNNRMHCLRDGPYGSQTVRHLSGDHQKNAQLAGQYSAADCLCFFHLLQFETTCYNPFLNCENALAILAKWNILDV